MNAHRDMASRPLLYIVPPPAPRAHHGWQTVAIALFALSLVLAVVCPWWLALPLDTPVLAGMLRAARAAGR